MPFLPLAAIHGEDLIGLMVGVLFMLIPIIAILTRHQQKMAQIMHQRDQQKAFADQDPRILAELTALRQLVAQQSLIIDDLAQEQRELRGRLSSEGIEQRLRQ